VTHVHTLQDANKSQASPDATSTLNKKRKVSNLSHTHTITTITITITTITNIQHTFKQSMPMQAPTTQ
jgi:hypothetical protein